MEKIIEWMLKENVELVKKGLAKNTYNTERFVEIIEALKPKTSQEIRNSFIINLIRSIWWIWLLFVLLNIINTALKF